MEKTLQKTLLLSFATSLCFCSSAFGMKEKLEKVKKKAGQTLQEQKKKNDDRKKMVENIAQVAGDILEIEDTIKEGMELYKKTVQENGYLDRVMRTGKSQALQVGAGIGIIIIVCVLACNPLKVAQWKKLLTTGKLPEIADTAT